MCKIWLGHPWLKKTKEKIKLLSFLISLLFICMIEYKLPSEISKDAYKLKLPSEISKDAHKLIRIYI